MLGFFHGVALGVFVKTLRSQNKGQHRSVEISLCKGPLELGVLPQTAADLFACFWVLTFDQTDTLMLERQANLGWVVEPLLVDVPRDAHKVSLSFDQVSQPVIAWEWHKQIFVHSVSANTVYGPFPGCDPCLINDVQLSQQIGGSDVCLFYMDVQRTALLCSLQRDNYEIPSVVYTFPSSTHLLRLICHPFELEAETTSGSVVSSFYPIQSSDLVSGSGNISSSELVSQDFETQSTENMTGFGTVTESLLEDLYSRSSTHSMAGTGSITSGNVDLAFTRTNSEGVSGTGSIPLLLLANIGVERSNTEALTGGGGITGGSLV